jgi:hypothetical protein
MKESVGLFFAMDTQWLWTGVGMAGAIRTGLNYAALPTTATLSGVQMTDAIFSDIRTLERSALDTWNRKRR